MSSRALRRLQRERGEDPIEKALADAEGESSQDQDTILTQEPIKNSLSFGVLADDEEVKSGGADGDAGTPLEAERWGSTPSASETESPIASPQTTPRKQRPSNKTKTKKQKSGGKQQSESSQDLDKHLDELLRQKLNFGEEPLLKSSDMTEDSIFRVSLDHLDPAAELSRKVGGIDIHSSPSAQSELPDAQARHRGHSVKAAHKKVRRYRRQLVTPRPTWTKVTSALVELRLEAYPDHPLYHGSAAGVFKFSPTSSYTVQFEEFAMLVELGDIDMMYAFARKHPLHVDALLTVGEFLRITSASDSLELTERALYILEKCTLATNEAGVDLTSGNMRLPYDHFDNRRIHLALLRYIQCISRNGCHRTALEFSKILWSLDPLLDPMGVRVICDALALQSEQYAWFDQVYTQICKDCPWMANWHYSNALRHRLAGQSELATVLLQNAIREAPWMVPRLAEATGIALDETSWLDVFEISELSSDDYLKAWQDSMAKIYAQRTGLIWKSQRNQSWLEEAIGSALSCQLSSQEESRPLTDYQPSLIEASSVLRHMLISDLPRVQVSLPVSIASGPMHPYDPLPPEEILEAEEYLMEEGRDNSRCAIQ